MLKHGIHIICRGTRLITVQDNTMLKPMCVSTTATGGLITVQDNTMLKLIIGSNVEYAGLITVQDNTMLKLCIIILRV